MIEKLYTVEEVAELASVTGRTIRNYQKNGRLTGRKIGGQWRFSQSEVQRLLSGEAQPAPPLHVPEPDTAPGPGADGPDIAYVLPQAEPLESEEDFSPLEPPPQAPQQAPPPEPPVQTVQQPLPVQPPPQPMAPQPPPSAYASMYSAPLPQQPYVPQQPSFEQPFAQYPTQPQPYAPMGPLQAPVYGNTPAFVYAAPGPQPMPAPPVAAPPAAEPEASAPERARPRKSKQREEFSELSDVGRRVATFASEVHDCSEGPQICTMIDMHQSLAAAKATSERLADFARQESENGIVCRAFVEFDTRYYIARYTLFGTSAFLSRCLMLIG